MGGSLYGIFVFLPEFNSHMLYIPITFCTKQIQESCYEIRFQVFIFLYLIGVTLQGRRNRGGGHGGLCPPPIIDTNMPPPKKK